QVHFVTATEDRRDTSATQVQATPPCAPLGRSHRVRPIDRMVPCTDSRGQSSPASAVPSPAAPPDDRISCECRRTPGRLPSLGDMGFAAGCQLTDTGDEAPT